MTAKKKQTTKATRKIRAGLFISVDGVTESPNIWQKHFDEEMGKEMSQALATQDAFLMGRKTYEEWYQYWPTNTTDPFASFINNIPKYVVSKTLDSVSWGDYDNITLFNDLEQVRELKSQEGQYIGMSGSSTLVRSLLEAGLLDELFLMIHPIIAGKGKKLFTGKSNLEELKLTYSITTSSGTIIVKYEPVNAK